MWNGLLVILVLNVLHHKKIFQWYFIKILMIWFNVAFDIGLSTSFYFEIGKDNMQESKSYIVYEISKFAVPIDWINMKNMNQN